MSNKRSVKDKLPPFIREEIKKLIILELSLCSHSIDIFHKVNRLLEDKYGEKPLSHSTYRYYAKTIEKNLAKIISKKVAYKVGRHLNNVESIRKKALESGDNKLALECERLLSKLGGHLDTDNKAKELDIKIEYVTAKPKDGKSED